MNKKVIYAAALFLLAAAISVRSASPYFNAVTSLNPAGYWPLHEFEPAVHGDTETNYGSLGVLGTGYYGDWENGQKGIFHGFTGALANDNDSAVYFGGNWPSGGGGSATNLLIVPHTSPLATLAPPFSVECWFFPTNGADTGRQGDIWAQGQASGLNGSGNFRGIRLYSNNGLEIFTANNNAGNNTASTANFLSFGSSGHWAHLVVTDDGTNITLFTNGVAALVWPNSNYAPNYWDPISVGGGKVQNGTYSRNCGGVVDEFAVYTNALAVGDIAAHYNDGVNGAAGVYKSDVLNDNPTIYLRMDSPAYVPPAVATWPAVTNFGSAGVNGVYTPGTIPGGAAGPNNGLQFADGFGAATNALPGNGMSSFVDAGFTSAFNPTGPNAFSISAWFQGNPADNRVNTIIGHSDNSYRVTLVNGHLQSQLGTNTSSAVTSTGIYNDGNWHQVVDVYTPNSTASLPGTNALYVDGILDNLTNGVTVNGILPGSTADLLIGADPQYTNNPVALGRQFAGQICEAAVFASALTASQVQTLYAAAEMPPFISQQPVSATANQNSVYTNAIIAAGDGPLSYQWYDNNVPVAGQTNASLILNPVQPGSAGNYYVVITNSFGAVTSSVAVLTVNASVSLGAQFPITYTNLFALYAGANPVFSVTAAGAAPISYYWFTNGVLDTAATGPSLNLTNVQPGAITDFCIVSNFIGSVTSVVWSATVLADPVNPAYGGPAPYPQAVLALNPIAYWRLNEADDGNNDGNPSAICHDYTGGNDALYTNVNLGYPGYASVLNLDGESSALFGAYDPNYSAASWVGTNIDFAEPVGSNGEFTVEAWFNSSQSQGANGGGIVAKGRANAGEEFVLDTGASNDAFRFLVRNALASSFSAGSTIVPVVGTWYHLVGVCDEANGKVLLYVNGQLAAQGNITPGSGIYPGSSYNLTIGSRMPPGTSSISEQSFGYVNDVAIFNYPLSAGQINNQYLQSGIAPYFTQQPGNTVNVAQGSNVVVSATVVGTLPLAYQWYETNTASATGYPVPGQTNAALVITNDVAGDTYFLSATNLFGTTNSSIVTVGVYLGPLFTSYLPVSYTNSFTLYAGSSLTLSVAAVSLQNGSPAQYQWYTNGLAANGATGNTFALNNLPPGSFTNYYCVASNSFGSSTSFVWSASVIVPPTNAYPQAVLSLHPIGYWRLDEADDGAGNYNAGVIAHDYAGGNDGIYTNTFLGNVGYTAPASYDPSQTLVPPLFGFAAFVNCDVYGIAGIDFSSPSNTSVAFSVEAWVNGYQQNTDAGIVAKGYGGGGEQFILDTGSDGGSPSHAFRFLVRDASGTSHSINSSIQPGNVWHHLVGVCDEPNGALSLYIDGQAVGTTSISRTGGILASTSLTSIGSRYSSATALATNTYDDQFVGYVNDVAVFNHALTAQQITNEFQGLSAPPVNASPTAIGYSYAGSTLSVSWPADHTGWRLLVQTNHLATGISTDPNDWTTVPGSTSVDQIQIPVTPSSPAGFYRLVYP